MKQHELFDFGVTRQSDSRSQRTVPPTDVGSVFLVRILSIQDQHINSFQELYQFGAPFFSPGASLFLAEHAFMRSMQLVLVVHVAIRCERHRSMGGLEPW